MKPSCWLLAALLLTATGVCAGPPEATTDQMQTIAGRLYLNDRELKAIYEEMHGYAQFTPSGPDRQLDYIQKLSLIIGRSRTHGYYLWQIVSDWTPGDIFIRPGAAPGFHLRLRAFAWSGGHISPVFAGHARTGCPGRSGRLHPAHRWSGR